MLPANLVITEKIYSGTKLLGALVPTQRLARLTVHMDSVNVNQFLRLLRDRRHCRAVSITPKVVAGPITGMSAQGSA